MKSRERDRGRREPLFHRGRVEAALKTGKIPEHSICGICGAVYADKSWRSTRLARGTPASGVNRTECPACRKVLRGEGKGRVMVREIPDQARLRLIQQRVRNVAARARFSQPERRLVRVTTRGLELEVITTSQELAYRIAREIDKAFGSHTRYAWSGREKTLEAFCQMP